MTRKEQLSEIGGIKPKNYVSKVIIPLPHNFYQNDMGIFHTIKASEWSIMNDNSNQTQNILDAFNIKKYIYENIFPSYDNSDFINNFDTLYLKRKINKELTLEKFNFVLYDIDLWIFEENIAFFVLNINIDYNNYTIDELTDFNRLIKNFKFLKLEKNCLILNGYDTTTDIINYLLNLTVIDNKSFLNINIQQIVDDVVYNTSTNAKLLVGIETPTATFKNKKPIEKDIDEFINFDIYDTLSILQEVPFYVASSVNLNLTNKSFTPAERYIYNLINNQGINIWKYSSGIALHDSLVLFGLGNGGGPIVDNTNNIFYFIYILNLYINFQIRYIERKIINKDFESKDITYYYKKLQKLKNQFITDEIAVKFQENEIHKAISTALKTNKILSEVTENLIETKTITDNNIGLYISLLGFAFVSIFQEPFTDLFKQYPIFFSTISIVSVALILKYRNIIRNKLKL